MAKRVPTASSYPRLWAAVASRQCQRSASPQGAGIVHPGIPCRRLWATCTLISSTAAAAWLGPLHFRHFHPDVVPASVSRPSSLPSRCISHLPASTCTLSRQLHIRHDVCVKSEDLLYLEQTLCVLKIDPQSRTVKHRWEHAWQLNPYWY